MFGTSFSNFLTLLAAISAGFLMLVPQARADMVGHGGIIRSIDVSPDGELAVTGSFDHSLRIWRFDEQREIRLLDGHDGPVNKVTFDPDGKHVASAAIDGSVLLWNETSDDPTLRLAAHNGRAMDVAISPSGRLILSGGWDHQAVLWRLQDGQETNRFSIDLPIVSVAFGPEERTVILADRAGRIHAIDSSSGTSVATVNAHNFGMTQLRGSPNASRLISIGLDNAARIWDSRTLMLISEFTPNPETKPIACAISGDGRTMLVAYIDGNVLHLDADSGKLLRQIKAETGPVWAIAFSANNRFALSAGTSETVKVWHLGTGDRISTNQTTKAGAVERLQPWLEDTHPGARLFRKCAQCHALTAAEPQRAGPHFEGLFGRRAGTVPHYRYSGALNNLAVDWNRTSLTSLFSEGPDKYVPGTKMPVQKINDPKALNDLIDYIQILVK